ncbi:tbc1 domain family member 13 [Gracilaria domingensis]|nr:tbc1 domain family member 13 [Gracilaria domingensis]
MGSARQVELVDLTNVRARRRSAPPSYAPPPAPAAPPPAPPDAAAVDSPTDIITAQIRHALTGIPPAPLSHSPSGSSISSLSIPSNAPVLPETREELFRACLRTPTVDVDELRRLVWAHGIPPVPWARPLVWQLLTNYLPPDRVDWQPTLAAKRARYWARVANFSVDPTERPVQGDHPLSDAQDSQWKRYFDDCQLRTCIRRDVHRTHPHLHRLAPLRDGLERVLFVYVKMHSKLGYRQGMNELAAPFLLTFAEGRVKDLSDVEADAYFCFESIMSEMVSCYEPSNSDNAGIGRQLRELQALLRIKDPALERRFEELGIDTRFYGLRWIRLWLMQEFLLPDCLCLWDSFLTSEVRLPWIRYVCVAMAIRIRERLLSEDFAGCMKLLLNYPPCDVSELLRIADRLRTSNVIIVRTARR